MSIIYVGREKCGCITACEILYDKVPAKEIVEWVNRGLAVERIEAESIELPQSCSKCRTTI
jgi:hypothetical protein